MKKIWLIAAAALCVLLSGCADLPPPENEQITADLMAYYQKQEYPADGGAEYLSAIERPEILEQTTDRRGKIAYIRCRARIVSDNALFAREDVWELWYTYDRRGKLWTLTDKDYSGTEYELLSDLSWEQCVKLMQVPDGQTITMNSLNTDHAAKTAAAVYSYDTETAQFGEFGSLTMNAVVQENFVWQADSGWQYTDSVLTDATKYTGMLGCYIGDDGAGMLNADRCAIGFDLVVIGDLICIENLRYQGSRLTPGTLHIGKTYLTAADEGRAAVIGFSYVREVEEGQEEQRTISGDGSITITAGADGNYYAELYLGSFITDGNGGQTDLIRSGIPLKPVRGTQEPPVEEQPQEPEEPIIKEPEKNWIGTWVGYAPEEYGIAVKVTVQLRADGTCTVKGSIELLGTITRETIYRVVEDISQLPTDLMATVLLGQVPMVSVVYDAQNDRLCTCLEEGVYVYLSRA